MSIQYYIILCLTLFSIGVVGVLTRRNAIIVFMCIELMLNAVNLLLVAFSKMYHGAALQSASVGLAIIVMMYRNTHSVDINFLNRLKN